MVTLESDDVERSVRLIRRRYEELDDDLRQAIETGGWSAEGRILETQGQERQRLEEDFYRLLGEGLDASNDEEWFQLTFRMSTTDAGFLLKRYRARQRSRLFALHVGRQLKQVGGDQVYVDAYRDVRESTMNQHDTLAEFGVSLPQAAVLEYLLLCGACPMGDMASAFGISRGNLTGIVDRLERDGFLTRQRSILAKHGDRRVVRIALTPSGHQLAEKISKGKV